MLIPYGAINYAVMWLCLDMAAPRFEHVSSDQQASLAELVVSRAARPSFQEIIKWGDTLRALISDPTVWPDEMDELVLQTKYEPQGFLAEAIRLMGRHNSVHWLSWFQKVRIKRDGAVEISAVPAHGSRATWNRVNGGSTT